MKVSIKKKILFNLLKNRLTENRTHHNPSGNFISPLDRKEADEPIVPVPHMSVQLSVEEPPVSDPDFIPGTIDELISAAARICKEVPVDQIEYYYQELHKSLDSALDNTETSFNNRIDLINESTTSGCIKAVNLVIKEMKTNTSVKLMSKNISKISNYAKIPKKDLLEMTKKYIKGIELAKINQTTAVLQQSKRRRISEALNRQQEEASRRLAMALAREIANTNTDIDSFPASATSRQKAMLDMSLRRLSRLGVDEGDFIDFVKSTINNPNFDNLTTPKGPAIQKPERPTAVITADEKEMLTKSGPSFADLEREEQLAIQLASRDTPKRELPQSDLELTGLLGFLDLLGARFEQIVFNMSQANLIKNQGGLTPDYEEAKDKYLPLRQIKSGPLSKRDAQKTLDSIKNKYGLTPDNLPNIQTVTTMDKNNLFQIVQNATQAILNNADNNKSDAIIKNKFDKEYKTYTMRRQDGSGITDRNEAILFIVNLLSNKLIQQGQEGQAQIEAGANSATIRKAIAKYVYGERTGKLRKPPFSITNETILMRRLTGEGSLYVDESNRSGPTELLQKIINLAMKDSAIKKLIKNTSISDVRLEIEKYIENLQVTARQRFPAAVIKDSDDEAIVSPEQAKKEKQRKAIADEKRFFTNIAEDPDFPKLNEPQSARQWYNKHVQGKLFGHMYAIKSDMENLGFAGMTKLRIDSRKAYRDIVDAFHKEYQNYLANWDFLNKDRANAKMKKIEDQALTRLRDDLDDLKDFANSSEWLKLKENPLSQDNPLNDLFVSYVNREIREKHGELFKKVTNYMMDTAAPNIVRDIFTDMYPNVPAEQIAKMTKELQEHISGKSNRPWQPRGEQAEKKFNKYNISKRQYDKILNQFAISLDEVFEAAFTSKEEAEAFFNKQKLQAKSIKNKEERKKVIANAKARLERKYKRDPGLTAISKKLKSGFKAQIDSDSVKDSLDGIASEYIAAFRIKSTGQEKLSDIEKRLSSGEEVSDEEIINALESEKPRDSLQEVNLRQLKKIIDKAIGGI